MTISRKSLPVVSIAILIAAIGAHLSYAEATHKGAPTASDTTDRATPSRATPGRTTNQTTSQPIRRSTPVPESTTTDTPDAPAPFKREWFYLNDKPVMWNKLLTQIGDPAPELAVENWRGDAVSMKAAKGDIVILDFWATWCGPCKKAMPTLNAIAEEYADKGVRLIGICDNTKGADEYLQICEEHNVNFPMSLDTGERATGEQYGRLWFPFIVLVDREGVIRARGLKPDHLKDALDAILAEQPAPTAPAS